MKKIVTLSFILCLAMFSFAQTPEAYRVAKQKVLDASSKNLVSFLNNIPEGFEEEHGFHSRSEFKSAQPGSVYAIKGVDEQGKAYSTNFYNVAVVVNDEFRAMVMVELVGNEYVIQTVGASLLAKELQVIENNNTTSKESEKIMLNFYDKKCGFVAYEATSANLEKAEFTPLTSAKSVLTESNVVMRSSYKLADLRSLFNQ